jgi:hypothetical protein
LTVIMRHNPPMPPSKTLLNTRAPRLLACMALVLACVACQKKSGAPTDPAAGNDSAAVEKQVEKGPVKLTVKVSPKQPRLSDLVSLELIVTAAPEIEVTPPVFGQSVGEFSVLDYNTQSSITESGEKVRHYVYQLEPTQSGPHLIRSFSVEFADPRAGADAKPQRIESEPVEVNVSSDFGDQAPSLANLEPMSPPEKLAAKPLSLWQIALIGAGAPLFIGLVFLALRLRRRVRVKARERQKTPEELAREELEQLLAEDLPNKGLAKEFYVRLTGIVRRYIEATTGLRAPEQTTEEFLRDMRSKQVFDTVRAGRLAGFLEAADMVKYAGLQPGQEQVSESVARAREFVGVDASADIQPASALPPPEKEGR